MTSQLRIAVAYVVVSLTFFIQPLRAQGGGNKQGASSDKTASPNTPSVTASPADAVHDVMTVTSVSSDACSILYKSDPGNWAKDISAVGTETQQIVEDKPLSSWAESVLATLIAAQCPNCGAGSTGAGTLKKSGMAYVFHLTEWSARSTTATSVSYVPVSSDWHVYEQSGLDTLKVTGFTDTGDPRIFNKKDVMIIGLDHVSPAVALGTFGSAYSSTATQGTPQNQSDLAALISALAGVSNPLKAQTATDKPTVCSLFLAAGLQHGTQHLPFNVKVTVTSGKPSDVGTSTTGQNSASTDEGSQDASKLVVEGKIDKSSASCNPTTDCADMRLRPNTKNVWITTSGSFSGSLIFEVGKAGTYTTATAADNSTVTPVTAPGTWKIATDAQSDARVRGESWNTGTANVSLSNVDPTESKPTDKSNGSNDNKGKAPADPAPGVMTCNGPMNSAPCTSTRSFTSEDPEWWDVGIGIAIPGVRESKYSIVSSTLTKSVTTHTDLYGMFDLYPFFLKTDKNDWAPHFNVGIPLTSQSLYRPAFGLAESLGGILSRIANSKKPLQLPVNINAFAGAVWMKTKYVEGNPTTSAELSANSHSTRVWKPIFGIEVPVSSIASKIKGAGSKNSNGNGKTSGSGAAGNG